MGTTLHIYRSPHSATCGFSEYEGLGTKYANRREVVKRSGDKEIFACVHTLDDAYAFAGHHLEAIFWHHTPEKAAIDYLRALLRHP